MPQRPETVIAIAMLIFAAFCLVYGVVFMRVKDHQKSSVLFMVGSAAGWTAAIMGFLGGR